MYILATFWVIVLNKREEHADCFVLSEYNMDTRNLHETSFLNWQVWFCLLELQAGCTMQLIRWRRWRVGILWLFFKLKNLGQMQFIFGKFLRHRDYRDHSLVCLTQPVLGGGAQRRGGNRVLIGFGSAADSLGSLTSITCCIFRSWFTQDVWSEICK